MFYRKNLPGRERAAIALTSLLEPSCQRAFSRNFRGACRVRWLAAANWDSAWPRFREMTLKSLHDDHIARFASRTAPFATTTGSGDGAARQRRTAQPFVGPFIVDQTWEK
jgi:hypothetical protein